MTGSLPHLLRYGVVGGGGCRASRQIQQERGKDMAKRSELEVGQEWAYAGSRNHRYGERYKKVKILSVEPYRASRYGKYPEGLALGGQGVLVEITEHAYGGGTRQEQRVYQLSQLWQPWSDYEVGKAEWDKQEAIRRAKKEQAEAEAERFREEQYLPAYGAFIKAVEQATGKRLNSWDRVGEMPIEVLRVVTEALKVKGVA